MKNATHYVYKSAVFLEKYHRPEMTHRWMERHFTLPYYICGLYIATIFAVQRTMKNRRPFHLKGCLIFWNLSLTAYNLLFFSRILPELYHALFNNGFHYAVCDRNYLGNSAPVTDFWSMTFVASKMLEFGDTIFIVLRKQSLIFLHWYHHVLTLCYGWHGYVSYNASGRLGAAMNSCVHVIMYLYYALRATGFPSVSRISPFVTFIQIVQMFVGCALNLYIWRTLLIPDNDIRCDVPVIDLTVSSTMYLSYLFMFCRFFYNSYCVRKLTKTD